VWMHNHVREEDISLLPPDRQQYGFISGGESYPTSTWIEGAVYRARKVRELAPGEYSVVFGVWVPGTEIRLGTEEDPDTGAVDLGWHVVGER